MGEMMPNGGPLNDEEYTEHLAGRIHGINSVLLALTLAHPDPGKLLYELERVEQAALAQVESSLLSDQYIAGMNDSVDRARNALRLRLAAG
jgi:hypothetical protein